MGQESSQEVVRRLGLLLRHHREQRHLTQEGLVERAGLGISVYTVSNLERGQSRPRRDTLDALLAALKLEEGAREEVLALWRVAGGKRGEVAGGRSAEERELDHPVRPSLPLPPTPFIGREREKRQLLALLEEVRLVTLTGPGGVGKTRLALEVAREGRERWTDGVSFVPLASLTDVGLVLPAVAQVVGVREGGGQGLREAVRGYLQGKEQLLVLDNFEHLTEAAGEIGELLSCCDGVRVLVTSRAVLRLAAEQVYVVPPLSVPDVSRPPDITSLSQYDAVILFGQRARAAQVDFALTEGNAGAVVEICRRLEGLPLAIELAAARVRLFPPEALLGRLSSRLKVLTGGARDVPARQQTLRGAIDWSYSLLDEGERKLFARLAVFVGGCSLEAAEAIANGDLEIDIVDGVTSLIEKSLLRQVEGRGVEPRFAMLETIREYAGERLDERGEGEGLRKRHAAYFLALAEEVAARLSGTRQVGWLERVEEEHDNLRAALRWALDSGDGALGLRLAGALGRFWELRGHLTEGRRWLQESLAAAEMTGGHSAALRAKALSVAGRLAFAQNDATGAAELFEQSLPLYREVGDTAGLAEALAPLGEISTWQGNPRAAVGWREEALALARERGDAAQIAQALLDLAQVVLWHGDLARLGQLGEESLALYRELRDAAGMAGGLQILGHVAQNQGESERARGLFEECVRLVHQAGPEVDIRPRLESLALTARSRGWYARSMALFEESMGRSLALGDRREAARTRYDLACSAYEHGEYERATALYEESLAVFREVGDLGGAGFALVGLGLVAGERGDAARVVELCEESLALFKQLGDVGWTAHSLHALGLAAWHQGDYRRAEALLAEILALFREYGHKSPVAQVLGSIGLVALDQGDDRRAEETFAESLTIGGVGGSRWLIARNLEGMAGVAVHRGQPERAARLFGAAEALRTAMEAPISPALLPLYERHVAAARAELGEKKLEEAWEEGRAMTIAQALACAVGEGGAQ